MDQSHSRTSKKFERQPGVWYTYVLSDVVERRRLLIDMWEHELRGHLLTPGLVDRCITLASEALPATVCQESLAKSLLGLAGSVFTDAAIEEAASRLAGNIPRLVQKKPAYTWHRQGYYEWVPVQIIAVRKALDPRTSTKRGAIMTLRILGGSPCPRIIDKWWSNRHISFLASSFGFSRIRSRRSRTVPPYLFQSPLQLVNMRLYVLVEPKLSEREPGFQYTYFPDTLRRWNKDQVRLRFRVDPGYECAFSKPLTVLCHRCPVGYERCRAGTHRHDYVAGTCGVCHRDNVYVDPARPGVCVTCFEAAAYERPTEE